MRNERSQEESKNPENKTDNPKNSSKKSNAAINA
jgi:hypothetical protein